MKKIGIKVIKTLLRIPFAYYIIRKLFHLFFCKKPVINQEPVFSKNQMLLSQLCTEPQMRTDLYKCWVDEMKEKPAMHRKQWEFVYILQALEERGMIVPGKKGVGFGVGKEPLPAVFVKNGIEVLATDLSVNEAVKKGWSQGNQHMSSKEVLNEKNIADSKDFERLVSVRDVDMNNIPADINGYDFTWSACAFEHLGDIEKGLLFVENSLKALKPGGVAVHTTEYNVHSDNKTLTKGNTVIFRKQDILKLVERLTKSGHEIYVNFDPGSGKLDEHIDVPPYKHDPHLKLQLRQYVVTSIGLIIRKKL